MVLHQIVKDLRLLRWHVAAWLLVVAVANLLVLGAASRWFPDRETLRNVGFIVSILDIVATGVMVVVAALVVQGDAPTSTTAFWSTRPAPRGTVAASKMIFGLVFLALVPLAWDAIDLAIFNVSPTWVPPAALGLVALWTFVPMAAAAVTTNLPQFFLITVFQVVIFVAVVGIGDAFGFRPSSDSAAFVGLGVIAAVFSAAVVVVAYATRRQRLSSALVGLCPVVVFGIVATVWPYNMDAAWRLYDGPEYRGPVRVDADRAGITLTPTQGVYRLSLPLRVEGLPSATRVSLLPTMNQSWIEASGKRVKLNTAPALAQPRSDETHASDWAFLQPVLGDRIELLNPGFASPPIYMKPALRLLSADYARYENESVTVHFATALHFTEWRAVTTTTLRRGERHRADGIAMEIGAARIEGGKVFAAMREAHSSPYAGTPVAFSYFLRNRRFREAIAARHNGVGSLGLSAYNFSMTRMLSPAMHDLWVDWLDLVFDVNLSPNARSFGVAAWVEGSELLIVTRRSVGNKEVQFDVSNVRLGELPSANLSSGTDAARGETRK